MLLSLWWGAGVGTDSREVVMAGRGVRKSWGRGGGETRSGILVRAEK